MSASEQLTAKVALVTGSDSGIGQATAIALARAGADLIVVYHTDKQGAESTRQAIEATGRQAMVIQTDVSDIGQAQALFSQAVARFGRVDILVNDAGVNGAHTPVADMDPATFEHTIRVNLFAPFYLSQLFVRHCRERGGTGKIINVSSIHEEIVQPGTADYCVSKGGLRNLMRTLSLEVAAEGITVNNVAPGLTLTPINQALIDDPAKREQAEQKIPMKRAAQPDEIAQVVLFLASPAADYVTGSSYVMDGGFMLTTGQGA